MQIRYVLIERIHEVSDDEKTTRLSCLLNHKNIIQCTNSFQLMCRGGDATHMFCDISSPPANGEQNIGNGAYAYSRQMSFIIIPNARFVIFCSSV